MRLGDLDALRDDAFEVYQGNGVELETLMVVPLSIIDNAPTVPNEYTKGFADGERSGRNFPLTDEEKAILIKQWGTKGEWIIKPKENSQSAILICNKCNHFIPITIDKNFCPNCGARMEKGDKEC